MSAPLLSLANVQKSFFGVCVLKGVSFEVRPGTVLGLLGENGAGKSTLMNIIGGNLRPDAGELRLNSVAYQPKHPTDAARAGIAFVHQELNLFANLTIAENLFLTRFPRAGGMPVIARGELNRATEKLLAEVGLSISPRTLVERLSPGERQLVEMAKALALECGDESAHSKARKLNLIILDEPTTSLSARETENLFALIERLRDRGVGIIYISHSLGDVLRLSDVIVVLRDGEVVGHGSRAEFPSERMISLMVGRELNQLYPTRRTNFGQKQTKETKVGDPSLPSFASVEIPALQVRGVTQPHIVREVSFALRAGEVLGISGLMGAGRSELARILFGIDPHQRGEILVNGKPLGRGPRGRIREGVAFVTEDRRGEGLCMEASIAENIAMVTVRRDARTPLRLLNRSHWRETVQKIREAVKLTPSARDEQAVKTLSGGNQQKVVLAKWLLAEPRVFILDEPTRGIDVGAKFEIYQLIHRLADNGAGVLVISSEMEELIGICDRILVMSHGEICDELRAGEFDRERMLRAALMDGGRVVADQ